MNIDETKIQEIKHKFDAMLKAENKNVDELRRNDKPYMYLHGLKLIGFDGKTLSMVEKFKLLGYERATKLENPLVKGKRLVEEYLQTGHTVDDLTREDKALRYMQDCRVRGEDGKLLSLEEKFEAIGHPRAAKRTADVVGKMRQMLIDFIERTGRSLDSLTKDDPEYRYVWGVEMKGEDGHLLTLTEKFAAAGFERKPKYSTNVKQDLIDAIEKYRADGGSFHVVRKTFPFYTKLYIYCDSLARNGQRLSYEQIMKDLGYKEYSDLYYRYSALEKFPNYRDSEGFVDSYKSDAKFRAFVHDAAISLDIPIPVLIELVCEENVRDVYLGVDYFSHVKSEILKFANFNKNSLEGVTRKAPNLYSKIRHIANYVATEYGENISTYDVLKLLGVQFVDNKFKSGVAEEKDIEPVMASLQKIAESQDGKLYFKDIPKDSYRDIVLKSVRLGVPTKAFFKLYDIDYVDGRNNARLDKIHVDKYPYIDEMRKRKQQLIQESGISAENGHCKEEIFEENIRASLQTYEEFKEKIYNFEDKAVAVVSKFDDKDKSGN